MNRPFLQPPLNFSELITHTIPVDQLIRNLFKHYTIQIGDNRYVFGEVEYYMYNENKHADPFVHRHPEQQRFGQLYFHRSTIASLNFTLKGVDITFGPKHDPDTVSGYECYGGLLIRALYNINTNEYIDGPSKVVDEMLRKQECVTVMELYDKDKVKNIQIIHNKSGTMNELYEHLRTTQSKFDGMLCTGPRIGLKKPKPSRMTFLETEYDVYLKTNYRFCAFKQMTKKEKRKLTNYMSLTSD